MYVTLTVMLSTYIFNILAKIVKAKIVQLEEDDGSGPTKFDT